jgi:hypothetical protein
MRTISLPAVGISVSLAAYVAAIRMAQANPTAEFKHGLTCWWPVTGAEIMRQFRQGVHQRINAEVPYSQRGQHGRGTTS